MIVDAGPLVANVDVREVQHDACVDLLHRHFATVRPNHVDTFTLLP